MLGDGAESSQRAGGGNRTHTGFRPERCESSASAVSATPAPFVTLGVSGVPTQYRNARRPWRRMMGSSVERSVIGLSHHGSKHLTYSLGDCPSDWLHDPIHGPRLANFGELCDITLTIILRWNRLCAPVSAKAADGSAAFVRDGIITQNTRNVIRVYARLA